MIVFNSDWVLEPVLETITRFGPVVVAEGPVGYWQDQGYTTSTDRTNEILAKYVPEDMIVHGQWPEKDEMVNACMHLVPEDTTHIWGVDSDEVYSLVDMTDVLDQVKEEDLDSGSFQMHSFYGGFDHVMTGYEAQFEVHRIQRWYPGARWSTHRPPTILDPNGRPWREGKHVNFSKQRRTKLCVEGTKYDWITSSIHFYHYSYVFPRQMEMKAQYYYAYTDGNTIPDYFEEVYLPWVIGPVERRAWIEDKYQGVHDYKPSLRGSCFTEPWGNRLHPVAIRERLPELKQRFDDELRQILFERR